MARSNFYKRTWSNRLFGINLIKKGGKYCQLNECREILRTRCQGHSLTFSITSDILCKATELTEAKVYLEAPWVWGGGGKGGGESLFEWLLCWSYDQDDCDGHIYCCI